MFRTNSSDATCIALGRTLICYRKTDEEET